MSVRKRRQKGWKVSDLILLLVVSKWHHGSEEVNLLCVLVFLLNLGSQLFQTKLFWAVFMLPCLASLWCGSKFVWELPFAYQSYGQKVAEKERESRPPVVDSSNLTDQTTLFNCQRIKFKLDPDVLKLRQLESCNVSSACVDILNVVRVSPGPFCMGGSQIFLEAGMVVHCRTSFAQVAPRFLEALSLEWWFS